MKNIFISLVLSLAAFGQQITLTSAPAKIGAPATITVTLSGSGQTISAIEWHIPALPGMAASNGPASIAAGKNVICQQASGLFGCAGNGGTGNGGLTLIADGVLATITLPMPPTAAPIPLTGMLGANAAGDSPGIAIASGPLLTLAPISPCDINGDGKTDLLDVRAVVDQIEGVITPATADLNGDGKVNVVDLQRVVNAVQTGGACRTGA